MSAPDSRTAPARGRSSTRGRAGPSRGGFRGGRKVNGTSLDAGSPADALDGHGAMAQLKKKHSSHIGVMTEMFPGWTDADLAVALDENDGDMAVVAEKIATGVLQQFSEVTKPKDRARSKAKEDPAAAGAADRSVAGARGVRGRGGLEGARGGRGRGADHRGRGGHRGGRGGYAATNGAGKDGEATSVPTTESDAWGAPAVPDAAAADWDDPAPAAFPDVPETAALPEPTPAPPLEATKSSLIADGAVKKGGWASLFAKPAPAPAPAPLPPKQILTKPPPAAEPPADAADIPAELPAQPSAVEVAADKPVPEPETAPPVPIADEPAQEPAIETTPVQRPPTSDGEDRRLTPSKDPLTEENVEHIPDESIPLATQSVASTAGSIDPRHLTPLPTPQAPIGRPPVSGYATAANRLAGIGGRSASFQRRVLEQQEAVVMPDHNALDKTALQFGSMGLNGEPDPDVDEEREEPETRQAPQSSPPSLPRTSLPPAPPAMPPPQPPVHGGQPTPKQAPGLPPASALNQQQTQDASLGQSQPEPQAHQPYNHQYGRYGAPGMQQDPAAQQHKPYDPFSHQAQQSQFDQYSHAQPPQQAHHASAFGGLSSAPDQYSQYYTSDAQRNAYNHYYGNSYSQQESRPQASQAQTHDAVTAPQRSTSGFGAGPNELPFASQGQPHAQTAAHSQSRFAEAPGSGNNTPNPLLAQQQSLPTSQAQQHSMHAAQGHHQGGYGNNFGYGHPNYSSPYPTAYQNQFFGANQYGGYGGAGGGYQAKQSGMHGAPYGGGYGMSSQGSYDQYSSSPANTGAFGQTHQNTMRSTSGMGSAAGAGLDDYGRGSAQPGAHQQSSGYGGMNDAFGRAASGYGPQGGHGQQNVGAGQEESLKSYDNSKSGTSPALGQPGRPGSAVNSAGANAQSGLPPPQGQHSSFAGSYPGFAGQGNSYGGLGGLGGHGQSQGQSGMGGSQWGGYGNNSYAQYGTRSGWAQAYGHGH